MKSRISDFFQVFILKVLLLLPGFYLLVSGKDTFTLVLASLSLTFAFRCKDKLVFKLISEKRELLVDFLIFLAVFYLLRRFLL